MTEHDWDQKLNIKTTGRDDKHADQFHHPYEPTPYCVLERLRDSGYITKDSVLIDYGCGKGRVGFFLAKELGCRCIGLEYDPPIFEQAKENLLTFLSQTPEKTVFKEQSIFSKHLSFLCEMQKNMKLPMPIAFTSSTHLQWKYCALSCRKLSAPIMIIRVL